MIKELLSPILIFLNQIMFAQAIEPEVMCELPVELKENSGMVVLNDSLLLMHNDSGNEPCIYVINDQCHIVHKSCLLGAKNIDWEDMTRDTKGFIYLADLGNNNNQRSSGTIYKASISSILKLDTVIPEKITITYNDSFPPKGQRLMYDIESLYWHNDSLFFFSKNRREPFDGVSWVFGVTDAGNKQHNVMPIDSIIIKGTHRYSSWITSADYDPASNVLLLMGQDQFTAIVHNEKTKPYHGKQTTFTLPFLSQKESVSFGNAFVFLSDESFKGLPGKQLYRFPKKQLFEALGLDFHLLPINYRTSLDTNRVSDSIRVSFTLPYEADIACEIFDTEGVRVKVVKASMYARGYNTLMIDVTPLRPSPYVINIIIDGQPNAHIFYRERGEDEPIIPR